MKNIVIPLPESDIFKSCIADENIRNNYNQLTGGDIQKDDDINYVALSKAYINQYCSVSHQQIAREVRKFIKKAEGKCRIAHWGL